MQNRKADITFNTIVMAAVAVLVLIVIIIIFTGQLGDKNKFLRSCVEQGGQCKDKGPIEDPFRCDTDFRYVPYVCYTGTQKNDQHCCINPLAEPEQNNAQPSTP